MNLVHHPAGSFGLIELFYNRARTHRHFDGVDPELPKIAPTAALGLDETGKIQ
jgi:hypothetical protein